MQLNEEELKNSKMLQQISKLEEQIAVLSKECAQKEQVFIYLFFLSNLFSWLLVLT